MRNSINIYCQVDFFFMIVHFVLRFHMNHYNNKSHTMLLVTIACKYLKLNIQRKNVIKVLIFEIK